jgi:hypothetical protein
MYSELRVVLILLAIAATLVSGWFAKTAVSANLAALRGWRRTEGRLVGMAARDNLEIEFGQEPDTRRVTAAADHTLLLAPFQRVTVYEDPSDPKRARLGGFLQLWLWPATITLLTAVCCLALAGAFSLGRGAGAKEAIAEGRWSFSPQPPAVESGIVLRAPASEVKAPLFWSLLGVAAFCCGAFASSMSPFTRLWALLAGVVFMVITGMLAWNNGTLRISADSRGLRSSSALGWRQVRWEQVKSVELREVSPVTYSMEGNRLPFPGRTTKSFVFYDSSGRTVLHMSTQMQPKEDLGRFFRLCQERTGLILHFRTVEVPDI